MTNRRLLSSSVIFRVMHKLTFLLSLTFLSLVLLSLSPATAPPVFAQQYDLVIEGGRVIDPESGLDATRNLGITNGKIARISSDPLVGKRGARCPGPRRRARLY